eukprot:m.155322 g.155322  ORF g.155322 m.155322 type:complete len:101 (+) comp38667_c2_seq7:800-1102(+)
MARETSALILLSRDETGEVAEEADEEGEMAGIREGMGEDMEGEVVDIEGTGIKSESEIEIMIKGIQKEIVEDIHVEEELVEALGLEEIVLQVVDLMSQGS